LGAWQDFGWWLASQTTARRVAIVGMSREQTGADHGTDVLKVCVCDQKQGAYSEFRPDPNQGLDAFYHPYRT
jgi:hypothetical protein